MWLIMTLEKRFPANEKVFLRYNCDAIGNPVNDKDSTWYHG